MNIFVMFEEGIGLCAQCKRSENEKSSARRKWHLKGF